MAWRIISRRFNTRRRTDWCTPRSPVSSTRRQTWSMICAMCTNKLRTTTIVSHSWQIQLASVPSNQSTPVAKGLRVAMTHCLLYRPFRIPSSQLASSKEGSRARKPLLTQRKPTRPYNIALQLTKSFYTNLRKPLRIILTSLTMWQSPTATTIKRR